MHPLSKILIEEPGTSEILKKLADPLWLQSFGCVLGFDWHSPGLTKVVTGVLTEFRMFKMLVINAISFT
ncbi:MAG TPA: DUF763 domain-containing protein [Nitrososphaeraceae archaeon]